MQDKGTQRKPNLKLVFFNIRIKKTLSALIMSVLVILKPYALFTWKGQKWSGEAY